jgi:hypothetical protein
MNGYLRLAHLGSLGHVVVLLFAAAGCAGTAVTPTPIRYADLGHSPSLDLRGPFVVEFQAGDQVPVDFDFTGEDFELSPAHPTMTLIAKQHCFRAFLGRWRPFETRATEFRAEAEDARQLSLRTEGAARRTRQARRGHCHAPALTRRRDQPCLRRRAEARTRARPRAAID